nr:MAG TPA: holin [Caudoviricetes sp.]
MIDLTPIVNAFITLIGLLLTTFLIPWIRTKISNEKLKEIQKWTSVGVKAAEMIYTESGMGDAKKKYVRKFLESKGYKLDIETVDALIEATVRDMQQEAFEVAALPGADDENEEEKED